MGKLSDVIDARLKEIGITGSKMCDDLHMSRSTLTELRKGRASTLKAEKAAAIASYLGLSVEELIGKEKTPTPLGCAWYKARAAGFSWLPGRDRWESPLRIGFSALNYVRE